MNDEKGCQDCGRTANLFEDDGTGYCWEHSIEYAQEQKKDQDFEEETGISQVDITDYALENKVSIADAKSELLKGIR